MGQKVPEQRFPTESLHSPEEEGGFPWGSDSTVAPKDEEHPVGHGWTYSLALAPSLWSHFSGCVGWAAIGSNLSVH